MTALVEHTDISVRKRTPLEVLEGIIKHPDLPHRMLLLNEVDVVPAALDMLQAGETDFAPIDTRHEAELRADAHSVEKFKDLSGDLYDRSLLALYMASTGLQEIFPEVFRAGVRRGAQSLVTSSVYAINAHIENGNQSAVELPLNGAKKGGLKLELAGDEPLHIIRVVYKVMSQLREVAGSPQTAVTALNATDDFSLYRIWRQNGGSVTNPASIYIRPYGGVTYDPDLEYGRPGEGVEASISYVVDLGIPANQPLPIGKHRNRRMQDNRISIRLDREGVSPAERGQLGVQRDPTQESGTLSLDIGSVLGGDEWLSTKVGRFLAWGNLLRSEAVGKPPQLNHATHFFQDLSGHRDVFAAGAYEMIDNFETRKLTAKQIARQFSGAHSLAGPK